MNGEQLMMKKAGFVGVKEASEILDVAPNTIRAWGADGKITEYRHPANNYRLYKKNELEQLLKAVAPVAVKPAGIKRKKKLNKAAALKNPVIYLKVRRFLRSIFL